jgi:predicted enzyme related to lactoylglutathione lyase
MHRRHRPRLINSASAEPDGPWKPRPGQGSRLPRRGLLAALLGTACVAPGLATQLQFPAVVEPPSSEHHAGKVIFVELVTPDIAAAKQFYGGLFGWSFRDLAGGGLTYAQASVGGHTVAGLVQRDVPAGEHRQPAWLTFLSVNDVDAAKTTALQLGGKVLFEPHDFPDRGREAVLADPQGAVFAVLASSSGDTPDTLAAPGDWIWSSLLTSDPDKGAAFYQTLFNYEVFELAAEQGGEHLLLASDNYARASVNSLPLNVPNMHPHWLSYVRVTDTVAMVAKAVSLGGRVLVPPRVDRHGGRIAVVADPLGAPFGLLEWPSTETKEAPR